jgi:hypothetical protein
VKLQAAMASKDQAAFSRVLQVNRQKEEELSAMVSGLAWYLG